MKKLIVLLVLLAAKPAFSQSEQPDNPGLTVSQIDSISAIDGRSGVAEGQISSQKQIVTEDKKMVIKGEGQSTIAIYKHKTGKFIRLVKGEYRRNIRYEDKSSEEVFASFYYNEKRLFLIKATEIITNAKGEKTTKTHDIDVSKMNALQPKDFLFTENIQKWISQVDANMINLSKQHQ